MAAVCDHELVPHVAPDLLAFDQRSVKIEHDTRRAHGGLSIAYPSSTFHSGAS